MTSVVQKSDYILDHLNTIIVLLSTDLRIIYVNPAAEMFFSTSLDRMLNRPFIEVIHHQDMIAKLSHSLQSTQPLSEREVKVLLHQQEKIVDIHITPILDTKNKEILLEIMQQDRHLKITREEALFSQQQMSRELLRSMAHEVKNPLGGLRGAAQLLQDELQQQQIDDLQEYTEVIIKEADRLKNLVDRMGGPKNKAEKKWVNIHEICERVHILIQNDECFSIPVITDYDPSIPEIFVDPEQIIQALLNLTRNAAQSISECAHCLQKKITLKTRVLHHYTIGLKYHPLVLKLDVIDTGPGIDPKIQEHIFMPLISGRANGSGLGLSIAQSLLTGNDGLIECQSEPGDTVFSMLIPVKPRKNNGE